MNAPLQRVLDRLYYEGRQTAGRVRRRRQLARYFRRVCLEERGMLIGSGTFTIEGWLSTDLVPSGASIVYLDATKHWPMPSASMRYVVCEHMLPQVPYDAGLNILEEAHRVLTAGGILRISLADLDVIRLLPDTKDPEIEEYIRWSNLRFGSPAERADAGNPAHVINRMWSYFGIRYLYDETTLRNALLQCGFKEIAVCRPGESRHPRLREVDLHQKSIGEMPNRIESLILEATR